MSATAVDRIRAVETRMSFTRPADVSPANDGSGLLRARSMDLEKMSRDDSYEQRELQVRDCSALGDFRPDLIEHGFGYIDLSPNARLQAALQRVRSLARVQEDDAKEIRREMRGQSYPLGNGTRLHVFFVAPEGFLMRRAGPNGMSVNGGAKHYHGMNNHEAAGAVHVDQDVDGTPVRQILRRAAPWVFHHDSPTHSNARSPLFLLNIWIPLQQATRPLALMDKRSLDRRKHQIRFGLETDSFLDRPEDQRVNDIWVMLHDEQQQWYFTSEMDSTRAYIFETLSTPHGAFTLPGEGKAEALYRRLAAAMEAVEQRDPEALARALDGDGWPGLDTTTEPVTLLLKQGIAALEASIADARENAAALCQGEGASDWSGRATDALEGVVRKSLEMRAVGVITPDVWPLNRR